ncbi:hypothetical protein PROFUN_11202 [Planoprotostelium fungivorum]|uniref:DH domain-containing protein n=1 Tax=Planoprotostelium fungivorum TaxID=1890364 RepID=A0A2P6NAW0_9EUKA|nr:hypothetical protein PROFUN_11202 [Planoprotostelium fungivorum]
MRPLLRRRSGCYIYRSSPQSLPRIMFSFASITICSSSSYTMSSPPTNRRIHIIEEIISTEQTFVSTLETLIELFLRPIEAQNILPGDEKVSLFGDVVEVYKVASSMLRSMRRVPASELNVGSVIDESMERLKTYASFCAITVDLQSRVSSLQKRFPSFSSFLEDRKQLSQCKNAELQDFLICPMQRLTRYPLLLRKLIEVTPTQHDDYYHLQRAMDGVQFICTMANSILARTSHSNNMNRVHSLFEKKDAETIDLLSNPTRCFILEGDCMVYKKGKQVNVRLFLFDDILVMGKRKDVNYRLYKKITLLYVKSHSSGNSSQMRKEIVSRTGSVPTTDNPKHIISDGPIFVKGSPSFQITTEQEHSLELLTTRFTIEKLYFTTKEEKNRWHNVLRRATEIHSPKEVRKRGNSRERKVNNLPTQNAMRPLRPIKKPESESETAKCESDSPASSHSNDSPILSRGKDRIDAERQQRLNGLEAQLKTSRASERALKTSGEMLQSRVDGLEKLVEALKTQISTMEEELEMLRSTIGGSSPATASAESLSRVIDMNEEAVYYILLFRDMKGGEL